MEKLREIMRAIDELEAVVVQLAEPGKREQLLSLLQVFRITLMRRDG